MIQKNQLGFAAVSDDFRNYWKLSGRKVHGGSLASGKRKTARPFSNKKPLHLVLKSSRARGSLSMWKHKAEIEKIIRRFADEDGIKVYNFSNNGNHLHLLLRARDHARFKRFLRAVSGVIARLVLGAKKGAAKGRFWDALAFTRIADWGKAFSHLQKYVVQNILEAAGIISYKPRTRSGRGGKGGLHPPQAIPIEKPAKPKLTGSVATELNSHRT